MFKRHRHYWQHVPKIGTVLFVLGLIGGIALRLSIFMTPFGKFWLNLTWFVGVITYTIFYFVRISIENHRREICDSGILQRLKTNALQPDDVQKLHDMVASHCRSKVKYNYIAWFAISVVSLITGIFFTS